MERSIQETVGCMERYVHWRVGRGAAAMRMQKKGVSCPTANSQGSWAVMNGLPPK